MSDLAAKIFAPIKAPTEICPSTARVAPHPIIKTVNIILNLSFNLFFIVLCPYLMAREPGFFDWLKLLYNPEVGIGYIFISNLIASGATLLLLSPVVYNQVKWTHFSFSLSKKMFSYSFPLIIAGLAYATNEVLDKIIDLERRDHREIAIRPHPHEFYLYFDV